jgi:hypothetical protein
MINNLLISASLWLISVAVAVADDDDYPIECGCILPPRRLYHP